MIDLIQPAPLNFKVDLFNHILDHDWLIDNESLNVIVGGKDDLSVALGMCNGWFYAISKCGNYKLQISSTNKTYVWRMYGFSFSLIIEMITENIELTPNGFRYEIMEFVIKE